ncbi:transposase IS1548-like [Streptococcus suis]|nr:transposase IS1548-like [Streptococcus suis]
MEDYPEIVLSVPNSSIPHLLGLSRDHPVNLPTNNAGSIFEGLKDDWTLQRLNKADIGKKMSLSCKKYALSLSFDKYLKQLL